MSETNLNKSIKIRAIQAENVSDNLISLRRFADMGLSIHLDNQYIRIFDSESGQEFLSGIYEKPNWLLRFQAEPSDSSNSSQTIRENYQCTARLVTLHDNPEQSQQIGDVSDVRTLCQPSEIGREKQISEVGRELEISKDGRELEILETEKLETDANSELEPRDLELEPRDL